MTVYRIPHNFYVLSVHKNYGVYGTVTFLFHDFGLGAEIHEGLI